MKDDDARKVILPRHGTFWLTAGGAIAPLDHCDDRGNVRLEHCLDESYAHAYDDGVVRRFGKAIGHIEDLQDP